MPPPVQEARRNVALADPKERTRDTIAGRGESGDASEITTVAALPLLLLCVISAPWAHVNTEAAIALLIYRTDDAYLEMSVTSRLLTKEPRVTSRERQRSWTPSISQPLPN